MTAGMAAGAMASGSAFVPILFIVGFIGLFAAIVYFSYKQREKTRLEWIRFAASRQGIIHWPRIFDRPCMDLQHGPFRVRVETVVRGSGKNKTTYTMVSGFAPYAFPGGLSLEHEHFLSFISKALGGQDVQVGDPMLDNAFVIKAHDPGAASWFLLQPHVRQALLHFAGKHSGFGLNTNALICEQRGLLSTQAELAALVDDVLACLGAITQTLVPPTHPNFVPPPPQASAQPQQQAASNRPSRAAIAPVPPTPPLPAVPRTVVPPPPPPLPPAPPKPQARRSSPALAPAPQGGPVSPRRATTPLDRLTDAGLDEHGRAALVEELAGRPVELALRIDRVNPSNNYDVPPAFADGRTVAAKLGSGEVKAQVIFPASANAEIGKARPGETVRVRGIVRSWDALYERFNIEAVT